jgi:hypothetical protein
MAEFLKKLSKNKFEAHLTVFLLMTLPSIALYYAAQSGAIALIWVLLGLVVLANVLVLLIK